MPRRGVPQAKRAKHAHAVPRAPVARFDGDAAWSQLTDGERRAIGATALELVIASDTVESRTVSPIAKRAARACVVRAVDLLETAVADSLLGIESRTGLVPLCVGRICRFCGCTDDDACKSGCSWVAEDTCSACDRKPPR